MDGRLITLITLSRQEQSLCGQFTGQGTAVEAGTSITGYVMNDIKIKAD